MDPSRRQFLKNLGTATALFLSMPLSAHVTTQPRKKPNFVIMLADDCSVWDLGCYGSPDSITPNIDTLANEGIRFTNCFQAASMCSPTRHNLYTGIWPVKSGAYPNHTFAKEGTKSIVHYLKPLGYRVALAGKTHIAPESVFPFEYLPDKQNPNFTAVDAFLQDTIENDEPFCLFLCSHEPHSPWDQGDATQFDPNNIWMPPFMVDTPETRKNYCNYLAEINYLDGQAGEALSLLEKHGIKDDTLFMFLSEQGNSFPFSKWTCYDVGVHSACIARWPGKIQPGAVNEAMIEYTDMVPTLVHYAGGESPTVDGKSFHDVLTGKKKSHKKYTFSLQTTRGINKGSDHYGIRSVRSSQYRYIWNLTPEETFKNGPTEGKNDWWRTWVEKATSDAHAAKMVNKYQHRPEEELYDVQADPYCIKNLAMQSEYTAIKNDLRQQLLKWMDECGDKGAPTEMDALMHQPKARRERWLKDQLN